MSKYQRLLPWLFHRNQSERSHCKKDGIVSTGQNVEYNDIYRLSVLLILLAVGSLPADCMGQLWSVLRLNSVIVDILYCASPVRIASALKTQTDIQTSILKIRLKNTTLWLFCDRLPPA